MNKRESIKRAFRAGILGCGIVFGMTLTLKAGSGYVSTEVSKEVIIDCYRTSPSGILQIQKKKQTDTITIQTSSRCGQCKERIEGNMAFEKGVKDVSLDLKTGIATIIYSTKSTNPGELRKKISKLGYDADDVVADPVAYEKLPSCCKKDVERH